MSETEPRCRCWKPSAPQMDCPRHRDEVVSRRDVQVVDTFLPQDLTIRNGDSVVLRTTITDDQIESVEVVEVRRALVRDV